ncbi:unnamed protein product, partial [Nezara viridula]
MSCAGQPRRMGLDGLIHKWAEANKILQYYNITKMTEIEPACVKVTCLCQGCRGCPWTDHLSGGLSLGAVPVERTRLPLVPGRHPSSSPSLYPSPSPSTNFSRGSSESGLFPHVWRTRQDSKRSQRFSLSRITRMGIQWRL